jgi:phosphoglycolate phosphatase-like HAD superfamily hydrolase
MSTPETLPPSRPRADGVATAAALGAPEGGFRSGPDPGGWLERLLAACPSERALLGPSLAHWIPAIQARGGRATVLADGLPAAPDPGDPVPADQVWLDLGQGDPGGPDPAGLETWLARIGQGADPPLVVLLHDDHPARARTQRLAVDRPGRVLLLRATAGGPGGYALGRPELLERLAGPPEPGAREAIPLNPRPGGRLLVLDVDGVLIDPGRAFMEAVAGALADLAPGLAWDDDTYRSLKRAGGFNNDFRLAAAALALGERNLSPAAPAIPWPDLEARILALEPRCRVAVRRHYARTRSLERPLVRPEQWAGRVGDLAVFTGRPPVELAHAFALLGRELPGLGDSAPHLRKPRPEGLIQLADSFRAERITFVGDGRDDAAALRAARALRPEWAWTFAAVGPDRDRHAGPADLRAPGLLDLLGRAGGLP